MMYTMGYDDSEAEQQLKEIQEEEKDSYAKYQAFREDEKNLDNNEQK